MNRVLYLGKFGYKKIFKGVLEIRVCKYDRPEKVVYMDRHTL